MDWFLFIAGVIFIVLGLLFLFKRGFVEKMRKEVWKDVNDPRFQGKHWYNYDKYGRGIRFLVSGLILTALAIYIFIQQ